MLTQTDNQNIFAQYGAQASSAISNAIDFSLAFREGNGVLTQGKHYALSFSPKGSGDKNFTSPSINFTTGQAKLINHNLNKHPSVTVVDSGQNVVYGEVQYTDTNNLTVSFNATFSGNAYLN